MTFQELLKASANGLPMVKIEKPVMTATSDIGKITAIKENQRFKGCAVQFPGIEYDTWFWDNEGQDKRGHYMRELTLVNEILSITSTDL